METFSYKITTSSDGKIAPQPGLISDEIERLRNKIDENTKLLLEIKTRLQPILCPVDDDLDKATFKTDVPLSPLASVLIDMHYQLKDNNLMLNLILERLQI